MQSGTTLFDKFVYACVHCKKIIEPEMQNSKIYKQVSYVCPHCKSKDIVYMGAGIHEHFTYKDIKERMKKTIKEMTELWETIK